MQSLTEVNDPERRMWALAPSIGAPHPAHPRWVIEHHPQDLLAEVPRIIPDCRMVQIDAGHDVHENRPDAFVSAVLGWLDERRGAALR